MSRHVVGVLEAFTYSEALLNSETQNRSQDQNTYASQLKRTAEVIANGEIPIPVDWPQADLEQLLDLVHDARRKGYLSARSKATRRRLCYAENLTLKNSAALYSTCV